MTPSPSTGKFDRTMWVGLSSALPGLATAFVIGLVIAASPTREEASAGGGPEPLACNGPGVQFEGGVPYDWTVVDNEATGVIWARVANSGEVANYTGSGGDAASVSSDKFNISNGQAEFDTELRTNQFSIGGYEFAALKYRANYQHVSEITFERDYLDLDISTEGGGQWTTLLNWDEDHGTFREAVGQAVTVDPTSYVGMSNLILRWHYYDPHDGDNDWYAQVDDVELICSSTEKWGDVDCNGAVNAVDALKVQRFAASLSVTQTEPCVEIATLVNADSIATRPVGDVDCSTDVNSIDALKLQRFAAGLFVSQTAPCPTIGVALDLYY